MKKPLSMADLEKQVTELADQVRTMFKVMNRIEQQVARLASGTPPHLARTERR